MADIGKVSVKLTAETAQFISEFDRATAKARASMSQIGSAVSGLSGAFAALGAAASIGGFAQMVKSSIDFADHLNDVSQRTGISVERLAGLKIVADQSGTSLEGLGTALKKLSVNQVEAAAGNKELASVFKGLGISGTDSQQALYRLADVFATLPDGAQKTALAVKLLGKNGSDMIPLLNGGGDSLVSGGRWPVLRRRRGLLAGWCRGRTSKWTWLRHRCHTPQGSPRLRGQGYRLPLTAQEPRRSICRPGSARQKPRFGGVFWRS